MTAETYKALEEAIQAHASSITGGLVTSWHLAAATAQVSTDATGYVYCNDMGPPHGWIGLLSMAQRRVLKWEAAT